ncbi:MAG: spirocyclase AveC family protein [Porticoccaceae bacterium]
MTQTTVSSANAVKPSDRAEFNIPAATLAQKGSASAWAAFGLVWLLIALNAWGRWITSDYFAPVPITPGDTMADWRLVGLRTLEVLSTLLVLRITWKSLVRPWLSERRFGLDGMLLLSGILGFCADAMLNLHHYLFAFNAHSVNMGVWTAFMPFHTTGPYHYAESLLWGFPMYVYFGIGAAYAGCELIGKLRRKYPGISNVSAYALAYLMFCVSDFILENTIIRTTHAYMYAKTYEPLTVFAGTLYQFPIYESLLSSIVCLGFTAIRMSALESADGLSIVERGALRFDARLQPLVRILAVFGATGALFIVGYHLPFNWLGIVGESAIDLPSYMLPAMVQ